MNKKSVAQLFVLVVIAVSLSGLTGCAKSLNSTEYAAVYKRLPWNLGGYSGTIKPGSFFAYSPFWTDVYVIDTKVTSISYAGRGKGDNPSINDAMNTRAFDGNEIWLEITIQYHRNPLKIREIIEAVGHKAAYSAEAVEAFARGKIRAHLGELLTEHFYDNKLRYEKIGDVVTDLNKILDQYGLVVDNVILDNHRFTPTYQSIIDDGKKTDQAAQEAKNNIETVRSDKKRALQDMIAKVNKQVEDAKGKYKQAQFAGDAYVQQKKNEAEAIVVQGKNEAQATVNQINALKQAGSDAVVRLVIGKELMKSQAPFILINSGDNKSGLNLTKTDYNDMLEKFGIISFSNGDKKQEPTAPPAKK
ncbi:MAG: SPFH domain-containing protein [archaeon]